MPIPKTECTELSVGFGLLGLEPFDTPTERIHCIGPLVSLRLLLLSAPADSAATQTRHINHRTNRYHHRIGLFLGNIMSTVIDGQPNAEGGKRQ